MKLTTADIFKTFGEATNTSAEIRVLKWYFVFQVLQVFLVTTLASGAAAVASQIAKNPISIPQLLADKLPSASNTYLTYFVIQGLSNAPSNVLNYSDVFSFLCFDKFFDKTPRQKYISYTYLRGMQWGKLFPKYVNFVIIGKPTSQLLSKCCLTRPSNCVRMYRTSCSGLCRYRTGHFLL
jgi:hypothetical protein